MKLHKRFILVLALIAVVMFCLVAEFFGSEPERVPYAKQVSSTATFQPIATAPAAALPSPKADKKKTSPIRFTEGPADGSERVIAAVMRHANDFKIPTDGSVILVPRPPLAWYTMHRTDDLRTLTPFGYFYFLEYAGKVVAIARINNASGSVSPVGVATQNEIQRAKIIDQLPTLLQVKTGSYEARFLRVSLGTLYFDVIWLKSNPGGTDLIYQLAPSISAMTLPYGLQAGTIYKVDDFLKMIRSAPTP